MNDKTPKVSWSTNKLRRSIGGLFVRLANWKGHLFENSSIEVAELPLQHHLTTTATTPPPPPHSNSLPLSLCLNSKPQTAQK